MNKIIKYSFLLVLMLAFTQCRKDEITPIRGENQLSDVENVSFIIQIIDQKNNGLPFAELSIKNESKVYTSDINGIILLPSMSIPKIGVIAKIKLRNYHEQIKLLNGSPNSKNTVHIQMVDDDGSIIMMTGTEAAISGNGKLKLPESLLMTDGSSFQGNVKVLNHYFNPQDNNFLLSAPGNMMALDANSQFVRLASLGMYRITLLTENDQLLHIKSGDKAILSFPISELHNGKVPDAIPLWSMDESNGLWKEEGQATLEGNYIRAEVSHFSFWNIDKPFSFEEVCFTMKNQDGTLLPDVQLKFFVQEVAYQFSVGNTNSDGMFCINVPLLQSIKIEAFSSGILLQSFIEGPYTGGENVTLILDENLGSVFGKALDCGMKNVNNGYGISKSNEGGYLSKIFVLNENGTFKFFAPPEGQIVTIVNGKDAKSKSIDLKKNELYSDVNLGDILLCEDSKISKISGKVMFDSDEDGIGDVPVGGVEISLETNNPNNVVFKVLTEADGTYSLVLPPSRYSIGITDFVNQKVIASGDLSIDGNNEGDAGEFTFNTSIICRLDTEEQDQDNDFIIVKKGYGSISGTIKIDFDGDGIGDKTAQGISVLYSNGTSSPSYATGNDGVFSVDQELNSFGKLSVSSQGSLVGVSDYDASPDPEGNDSALGPNMEIPMRLKDGENDADNNFVFYIKKSRIICTVLEDTDNDGIGDSPVSNERVDLFKRSITGIPIEPRVDDGITDQFGNVFFQGVDPGEYVLYYLVSSKYTVKSGSDIIPDNNVANIAGLKVLLPVDIKNKEYDDGNTFVVKKK
jgi:hypothetical protein